MPKMKSNVGKEMKKLTDFARALDKSMEEWLEQLAWETYDKAREIAPVGNTGDLREAHQIEKLPNGFKITNNIPYAYALHEGKPQGVPTGGKYKSKVKAHTRTLKGYTKTVSYQSTIDRKTGAVNPKGMKTTSVAPRTTKVRAHTKTYKKGFKPTYIGLNLKQIVKTGGNQQTGWKTVNTKQSKSKNKWLQEAWKIVRKEQDPATRMMLPTSLKIEK